MRIYFLQLNAEIFYTVFAVEIWFKFSLEKSQFSFFFLIEILERENCAVITLSLHKFYLTLLSSVSGNLFITPTIPSFGLIASFPRSRLFVLSIFEALSTFVTTTKVRNPTNRIIGLRLSGRHHTLHY